MLPTLRAGDRLLVATAAGPRPGRIVVRRLPTGRSSVKRASERRETRAGDGWWVLSDNPEEGVDSWPAGPVPEQDVLAVVRARLWPRPSRLR